MNKELENLTQNDLIEQIKERVSDKVIEETNANLLIKLIERAETLEEAISIAELGTMYKSTGFHFDVRLEKLGDTIQYLKKVEELSFSDGSALNKLVIGDNYPALLNLIVQYHNKIDVIYIDPPYGKDNLGEFAQTNYNNSLTRDNLLSMLYPRLVIAKQLMSDDGVIFCSIDDRNQAYVKCLFDEIFEEKNFAFNITERKTKTTTGDDGAGLNIQHDYVLAYFKKEKASFRGEEKDKESYKNPDNDPNGPWKTGDPTAKSGGATTYFEIKNPYTGKVDLPPEGRFWAFNQSSMDEYIKNGRIKFKEEYGEGERGFIFKRYYNSLMSQYHTFNSLVFTTNKYLNSEGTDDLYNVMNSHCFDYPKPVSLVKTLVRAVGKKDSIVLDFFAGSGTTGQAVLELNREDGGNRTFILCTNNEMTDKTPNGIAYDCTSKRLKRIMTGCCYDGTTSFEWIKDNKPLGGSLEVTELAEVADFSSKAGETPFDLIDETLYGCERFSNIKEKIEWVCSNFRNTQQYIEGES